MENKRPRGREKKVVEGSDSVYKREEAKTGSGPVSGSSGRPGSQSSGNQYSEPPYQKKPGTRAKNSMLGTIMAIPVFSKRKIIAAEIMMSQVAHQIAVKRFALMLENVWTSPLFFAIGKVATANALKNLLMTKIMQAGRKFKS